MPPRRHGFTPRIGRMHRLTREVRFAVSADGRRLEDGRNGHAGRPSFDGLSHYFLLRVTLAGEPDPASSYLINIKTVDDVVRTHVVPMVADRVADRSFDAGRVVLDSARRVAGALPMYSIERAELFLTPFLSVAHVTAEPNMIRLTQKFEFSAAHRLHNPELTDAANRQTFGKCNNPHGHGHNYEIAVCVACEVGRTIAVHELERIVNQAVIEPWDHKHLNVEVDDFRDVNPSVENIARAAFGRLADPTRKAGIKLASVTVWETPKTWCEYSE